MRQTVDGVRAVMRTPLKSGVCGKGGSREMGGG
jgi:hypothetical protein